ncbi:MAG: hypothetical protein GX589_06940 [Deltaproteobacteria bacterium]|nr:hypothetical protein [Deltaproteobacteria bacterium]
MIKRPLYSPPEPFSLQPLLSFLPVKGSVVELRKTTSALYARYEKVAALRKGLGDASSGESSRRLALEEQMLKQILDWLASSGAPVP